MWDFHFNILLKSMIRHDSNGIKPAAGESLDVDKVNMEPASFQI